MYLWKLSQQFHCLAALLFGKATESCVFKEMVESIVRLTKNAGLFMTQSNNCRQHNGFQKALSEFSLPEVGELQCLPEPVANAGSWQGILRTFYLLLAKPGNHSMFACVPQEQKDGLRHRHGAISSTFPFWE